MERVILFFILRFIFLSCCARIKTSCVIVTSDAVPARVQAKHSVQHVSNLESQFYVILVNFRNYLSALKCLHIIYFHAVVCCVTGSIFSRCLSPRDVIDTAGNRVLPTVAPKILGPKCGKSFFSPF